MWACASCNANIQPRYNPFSNLALDENSDKFYDDEGAYDDQVIQSISNVLENCKHYTIVFSRNNFEELSNFWVFVP